jgi:hypothetical protein
VSEEVVEKNLGWYDRVVLPKAIAAPETCWGCAMGMDRPQWYQFWLKKKWLAKVAEAKAILAKDLNDA